MLRNKLESIPTKQEFIDNLSSDLKAYKAQRSIKKWGVFSRFSKKEKNKILNTLFFHPMRRIEEARKIKKTGIKNFNTFAEQEYDDELKAAQLEKKSYTPDDIDVVGEYLKQKELLESKVKSPVNLRQQKEEKQDPIPPNKTTIIQTFQIQEPYTSSPSCTDQISSFFKTLCCNKKPKEYENFKPELRKHLLG